MPTCSRLQTWTLASQLLRISPASAWTWRMRLASWKKKNQRLETLSKPTDYKQEWRSKGSSVRALLPFSADSCPSGNATALQWEYSAEVKQPEKHNSSTHWRFFSTILGQTLPRKLYLWSLLSSNTVTSSTSWISATSLHQIMKSFLLE